jgi:excisionase family DNA binding protein
MREKKIAGKERREENGHAREVLLLTINDAARLLSIGRTAMYELVDAGEIEVVHIGRCARVPVTTLEAFVERQRLGGATVRSLTSAARAKQQLDPGQPTNLT